MKDCIEEFDCCFEEVVPCHPLLYGDFMDPGAERKVYKLIDDKEKVRGGTPILKIGGFTVFLTPDLYCVSLY